MAQQPTAGADASRAAGTVGLAFSLGAIATFVSFISSVARSKVLAVTVGAPGLGVIAEATQVASLLTIPAAALAGPVLAGACAKARSEGNNEYLGKLTSTALLGALLLTSLVLPLEPLVMRAAVDTTHWPVSGVEAVITAGLTIAAGTSSGIIALVLGSSGHARNATVLSLVGGVAGAVIPVVATLKWGIRGALWSGPVNATITSAVAWGLARRLRIPVTFRSVLPVDRQFLRQSFALSIATLSGSYAQQFYLGGIRLGLERFGGPVVGAEYNGQFQAAFAIDTQLFALLTSGLFAYYWPRFAHANREISERLLVDVLRFTMGYFPLLLLCGSMCRTPLITALYAHRFETASTILAWLLPNMLVRVLLFTSGAPLLFANKPLLLGLSGVGGHLLLAAFAVPAAMWWGPRWIGPAILAGTCCYLLLTSSLTAWATGVRVPLRWFGVTTLATCSILGVDYFLRPFFMVRLAIASLAFALLAYRQRSRIRGWALRLLRRSPTVA